MNPTIRIIQETDRTFSFSVQQLEQAGAGIGGNLQFKVDWHFGDDQQGFGRRVLHTYAADGEFLISASIIVISSELTDPIEFKIAETLHVKTATEKNASMSTGDPHQDPKDPEDPENQGGITPMSTGDPHQDPKDPEDPENQRGFSSMSTGDPHQDPKDPEDPENQ